MRHVLLALSAVTIASWCGAQEARLISYQPEPDFQLFAERAVSGYRADDAFAKAAECRVVDALSYKPYSIEEAQTALGRCLEALSKSYGTKISVHDGVLAGGGAAAPQNGLVLSVPAEVSVVSPVMKDLGHALALRKNELLGHPAAVRREDADAKGPRSAAQDALDRCVTTSVVRKIESGRDFIRYYGRCLTVDSRLKIEGLRPAEGKPMGVVAESAAEHAVVDSLNGFVSVNAENGPVQIEIVAAEATVSLP